MAVRVKTDDPERLWRRIRTRARQGDLIDWILEEGALVYMGPRWGNRALFVPRAGSAVLTFNVVSAESRKMGATTYGVLHSRLIELLLTEFDSYFSSVEATALATASDEL